MQFKLQFDRTTTFNGQGANLGCTVYTLYLGWVPTPGIKMTPEPREAVLPDRLPPTLTGLLLIYLCICFFETGTVHNKHYPQRRNALCQVIARMLNSTCSPRRD